MAWPGWSRRTKRPHCDWAYRPRLERLEERRLLIVGVPANFAGIDYATSGGVEPPDSDIAAGPAYLVETVNISLAIYNKATGANVFQQNLAPFFAPAGAGPASDMFDPTVTYDDVAGRFVVSVLEENDANKSSFLDFAVSNDADPTHGFAEMHRVNTKEAGPGAGWWADFPRVGWNADAIVFSFNMYSFPSATGTFDHVQLLVIHSSTVLDANSASFGFVTVDRRDPHDLTLDPASMHGAAPGGPLWFAEENDGASNLRLVEMTNVLANVPSFSDFVVSVPTYLAVVPPIQPGGTKITTVLDSDVISVATVGSSLIAAQNVGNNGVTHARWYEFNLSGASPMVAQVGEIAPAPGVFTYFPAIDVAGNGKIGLTYTESSAQENMSMYVTGRAATDLPGQMESPILVRAGDAVYTGNRAGDFSGLSADPVDGSFWAANEFSNHEATNWGTWIAHVVPNAFPVVVSNLAISPSPAIEGPVSLSGTLTDPTAGQAHTLLIEWGDGSALDTVSLPVGVLTFGPLGHTYAVESPPGGAYSLAVIVSDFVGSSGSGALNVVVGDAPVTATPVPETVSQGVTFTLAVAAFAQSDADASIANYSAVIDWGDGRSSAGGIVADDRGGYVVLGTTAYAAQGTYSVGVTISSSGGATTAVASSVSVRPLRFFATAPDAGGGPDIRVFDAYSGGLIHEFFAYNPGFTGGVRLALADINGDGAPDIITAPGPGGGPDIRVFDGRTQVQILELLAYAPQFTGGVYVAAGDINGDGVPDIITGADAGGGPHVQVFSGKDGGRLRSFFAYDLGFRGGVRVAAGDVDGDGKADIVTAPGPGGGPDVRVYSGATGALIQEFFAYSAGFSGGVYVAAGDINGDGKADIITGAGAGGGPHVEVFAALTSALWQSFFAYGAGFTGGVRVGVTADINNPARVDILTAAGPGGGPHAEEFDGLSLALLDSFFAYSTAFTGGVYVGG